MTTHDQDALYAPTKDDTVERSAMLALPTGVAALVAEVARAHRFKTSSRVDSGPDEDREALRRRITDIVIRRDQAALADLLCETVRRSVQTPTCWSGVNTVDTIGDAQPTPEHDALYRRLVRFIRDEGVLVHEFDPREAVGGLGFGRPGELWVATNGRPHRVFVLLHEYAHQLLLGDLPQGSARRWSRAVEECHAEGVSYVVAWHFGLHNRDSARYLLDWGMTQQEIDAQRETILFTAATIIRKLAVHSNRAI